MVTWSALEPDCLKRLLAESELATARLRRVASRLVDVDQRMRPEHCNRPGVGAG